MFTENLDVFLQDMGRAVVRGGYSCTGLLDEPDQMLNGGGGNVISTMYELTIKTSDVTAGGFTTGASLTVDGVAYVVRDVMQIDDGALSKLALNRT